MQKHTEVALLLIQRGCDVNKRDSKGNLPLHYAVRHKNICVIESLLNAGKGNGGYFNFWGEYEMYFECGIKISIFHECAARVKNVMFSQNEMKYIWYLPKKSKFSFYFILNRTYRKRNLTFSLVIS